MNLYLTHQTSNSLQQQGKHHMSRVRNNVIFSGLKDQLDQINFQLHHKHTRMMEGVEYRHPSISLIGRVKFNQMKLDNDDDVRTMISIFCQYNIVSL